jgi:hypothetical protein
MNKNLKVSFELVGNGQRELAHNLPMLGGCQLGGTRGTAIQGQADVFALEIYFYNNFNKRIKAIF